MALEDRCSPQSAPSPPGLPQSPHQQRLSQQQQQTHHLQYSPTAASTVLDMSLHPHPPPPPPPHVAAATTSPPMLPHPVSAASNAAAAATLYHQHQQLQHLHHLQQLQQLHQQQLVNAAAFHHHPGFDAAAATALAAANHAATLHQRLAASPGATSTPSSTPASTMTIKEEENDSIMGDSFHGDVLNGSTQMRGNTTEDDDAEDEAEDEEDDIDVDDVDDVTPSGATQRTPPPAHQQSAKPTLTFSISNILSDRFGGNEAGSRNANETVGSSAVSKQTHLHTNSIFRPFDAARSATPSAFTRVDLLEFSRQQQAAAAAATAAMMLERANFLNCFNPAAYPRIHEEIVNSRMRRSGVLPPTAMKSSESGTNAVSSATVGGMVAMEKSALGSLCKAVSQIGQTVSAPACSSTSSAASASSIASPPPASNASSTSSSTSMGSSLNSSPTSRNLPSKSSSPQPIPPPSAVSRDSGMESSDDTRSEAGSTTTDGGKNEVWPAWVYCTRYSDRPSSGECEFYSKSLIAREFGIGGNLHINL